jgi:hypothetical protein
MYQVYDIHGMIMRYTGGTSFVVLFLFSLIYFYLKSEEEYKKRITIILVLSFILIFNNIMLSVVGRVIGYATYYRFFWGIPVVPIIALVIVEVIKKEKLATRKAVLILLFGLIVSIGGSHLTILTTPLSMPRNIYNIPNDVIEVVDIINNHTDMERPIIAANSLININIRQYDPSFLWGVRRRAFIQMGRLGPDYPTLNSAEDVIVRVVEVGRQNPYEIELFRNALEERRIDYVITWTWFDLDQYMEQVGFSVIGRAQDHTVYGRMEE